MLYWWTKALQHLDGLTGLEPADIFWPGDADRFRAALAGLFRAGGHGWRHRRPIWRRRWRHPGRTPQADYATMAAWLNLELMKNAAEIGFARFLYATRRRPQD